MEHLVLDCWSVILNKVSFVDRLSFSKVSKSSIKLFPSFKDIFIKRLLQHQVVPSYQDALLFCDALYNTGAYVAGSFIVDCLYDTNHHQDIDIYDQTDPVDLVERITGRPRPIIDDSNRPRPNIDDSNSDDSNDEVMIIEQYYEVNDIFNDYYKNNLKFTQALYRLGFTAMNNSHGSPCLRSFLHQSYPNWEKIKHSYPTDHLIKNIPNTIQIIPIGLKLHDERSFIPRFIHASFDLEICQSMFDGRHLSIKNMDKLIHRYDFIKPNLRFMVSVYPIDKETEEIDTDIRMQKYIDRGFDIQRHPKYHKIDHDVQNILISNKYSTGNYQYNIKYIETGEIDLSVYD